ncbi:MAG TPA: putative oxidoreductase C-terminal domain-containing protein [Stellaceae bacterium]|nr:putative oxidoreductase C-terminal domain-containing protein [Stellaceae bacterium]
MAARRLIVIDPGHFHAALVQKEMYATLDPRARIYAPLGPELLDYLGRIARFNHDPQHPTRWEVEVQASPDFLDRIADEPPSGIAVLSGRNRGKVDRIAAAVAAGLHVLADKPAIIRREDLPRFETALNIAERRGLVIADMMTGRENVMSQLIVMLRREAAVFGEPVAGSRDEPGVALSGVHHLLKVVSGVPNRRPAWYFDVTEQGEGLADTGVHLVDRAHETLFPGETLDYRRDIAVLAASRWPTAISLAQFREVTGEAGWPDDLTPWITGDRLDCFCNGRVEYRVRGIHVRLEARWDWQAEHGDDTHNALYRGTRCSLELRQGPAQQYRPELYVVPHAEIAAALERCTTAAQPSFPGMAVERQGHEWHVRVPDALRVGHEANFAQFTRRFLGYVDDPGSLPARDKPNLLAKYHACTEAVAMSHGLPTTIHGGDAR